MTAVRLHDLPPYLRAALLPAIRRDAEQPLGDGCAVRLVTPRGDTPVYLRVWDRGLECAAVPGLSFEDLQEALEAYVAAGGLRGDTEDLFQLVGLLSVWDDLIRELDLYPGRVYMASEEATRQLFPLAGIEPPTPEQFRTLLLEAQALELMYRFPVAFKFRRAYGHENQCRLNGWGRRLAHRAFKDEASARERAGWSDRLRAHLEEHREAYATHVDYVSSEGMATAPGDSWTLANELPVPILL